MSDATTLFSITLAPELAQRLAAAARELAALLRGTEAIDDAQSRRQRDRLLPDAYRDDSEAAAEFRRFVENDLVERKAGGAERVALVLEDSVTEERGAGQSGPGHVTVTLTRDDMLEWAIALTDIRLSLAVRLDIVDEEGQEEAYLAATEPEEIRDWEVYDWFGRLQERVIAALEPGTPDDPSLY